MSAASPVGYCWGWTSASINVVTVEQPAMVGCLQIQPVETISPLVDVQSQVGRKQVPVFFDATLTKVDPLGERLFLTVPAQTGLRQSSRFGVELIESITAGAFGLAAHHFHEQPRCPVAHTAREVLLPREVIKLLARHLGAVREQPVGQRPVQRLAMLAQPAVLLGHTGGGPFSRVGTLPGAAARLVNAVGMKAARRPRTMLTVQVSLSPAQSHGVQSDPISQRLNPSHPSSVASLDTYRDLAGTQIERHPPVADRMPPGRMPIHDHLHAVGVAPIDHAAHDPGGQHLSSRNQRLDFSQLSLLLLATSARLRG